METHTKTEFIISGFDILPIELAEFIGLKPTSFKEKGKFTVRYQQLIKENVYVIDSGMSENSTLRIQIESLLILLRPFKKKLIEICEKYPSFVTSTVKIYGGDRPPLDISKQSLKELSEYNVEFGIDIYIL